MGCRWDVARRKWYMPPGGTREVPVAWLMDATTSIG